MSRRARIGCAFAALALLSAWLALPVPADMAGGFGPTASAGGVSSGIAALEPDNAVVSSSTLLETTAWDTVALAPQFNPALTYDAALNTLPAAQGWTIAGDGVGETQAVVGGEYVVTNPLGATLGNGFNAASPVVVNAGQCLVRFEGLRMLLAGGVGISFGRNQLSAGGGGGPATQTTFDVSSGDPTPRFNVGGAGQPEFYPGYDPGVGHTFEIAASDAAAVTLVRMDGRLIDHRHGSIGVGSDQIRFGFFGSTQLGESGRVTRVRGVIGTTVYSAASPTADVVIDLGAGNTGVWDMSTILSDEREGAGALRYRYEAGAADPGAGDPLNGSDLSLTTVRTEGDPSGRFLRFRVVFPSDGTASQPRAWGGGSIAWTIP